MDFSEVKRLMDEAVEAREVPCSDIAVCHQGKLVYRYHNGTGDDAKTMPLKGDELYFLYSATKPVTCTAALQLYEQGRIALEDKVSDYLPEFTHMWVKTKEGLKKAKNPITLKHLFTMTSGMNYNLTDKSIQEQVQRKPDSSTLDVVRAMAGEPLEFEPGEHFLYSLSHDVLAGIVELVSGMSFGEYLKKYIFDVCKMERTGFTFNEEIRRKLCSLYVFDAGTRKAVPQEKKNCFCLTPVYQSGGAGLISCVEDYSKFVAELSGGNRLLKKETIDLMRANHLNQQAYEDFQKCKPGYTYGLGVRTDALGRFAAKGEFGWDGAAGSYVMIDPDHQIGIFYVTHVLDHGIYLYGELHPAIRDAVYRVLR